MPGRQLVDDLVAVLAIDECMCRQEPLRLAAQPSRRPLGALPHLEADRQKSTHSGGKVTSVVPAGIHPVIEMDNW